MAECKRGLSELTPAEAVDCASGNLRHFLEGLGGNWSSVINTPGSATVMDWGMVVASVISVIWVIILLKNK